MKVKTSELNGSALDWAVELANGTHWSMNGYFVFKNADGTTRTVDRNPEWRYSAEWSQGGPIIEREFIYLTGWRTSTKDVRVASIETENRSFSVMGPTTLIAAMRCFVTMKLGDEVDIPEELLT